MRSVRCERCGFVQAERATCRKCGEVLALGTAEESSWEAEESRPPAALASDEHATIAEREPPATTGKSGKPDKREKPAPEPITRLRSVPLTATLDPQGAILVEFRCRRCDQYGVILVPPELMETGIEGECGACRRSAPMTRVELAAKRFDQPST